MQLRRLLWYLSVPFVYGIVITAFLYRRPISALVHDLDKWRSIALDVFIVSLFFACNVLNSYNFLERTLNRIEHFRRGPDDYEPEETVGIPSRWKTFVPAQITIDVTSSVLALLLSCYSDKLGIGGLQKLLLQVFAGTLLIWSCLMTCVLLVASLRFGWQYMQWLFGRKNRPRTEVGLMTLEL